jgi:signal transduction histidine kinase
MARKGFKMSIKKQIIGLFIIFSGIIISLGLYNYSALRNYESSIREIRNSTILQLSLISNISLKASQNHSNIITLIYTNSNDERNRISKRVKERVNEVDAIYLELEKLIENPKTHEHLKLLQGSRKNYIHEMFKQMDSSSPPNEDIFLNYQGLAIISLYEAYAQNVQGFTQVIINDAEASVADILTKVGKARFISNLIIIFGIIILLINSYLILRIYRRLSKDYMAMQEEKVEKEKAQKELKKLNKELEQKVYDRTRELEKANREISLYNAELEKLSQAKDKFISVISHDLRNPIATIIASSDALLQISKENETDKDSLEFANLINRASKKIINQLNELVEWAKTKTAKKVFNPVKLNLWEAVNESFQILEALANSKEIKLINNIQSSLFIRADKIMFRSIIQNLTTNSIKFTTGPGSVTIDASEKMGMVEITVKDTGIGMDEKTLESIFDDDNNPGNGSGLGLYLVKDFVKKHKGNISVESEIGKGSIFTFTMPSEEPYETTAVYNLEISGQLGLLTSGMERM